MTSSTGEVMRSTLKGSCLCGGIAFEISGPHQGIVCCHCTLCRRCSGTGGIATITVRYDQVRWIRGEELVSCFQRPSGYGSAFCRRCGSPAPDPDRGRTRYGIPVGLLEDDPSLAVVEHIYVGSKAGWEVIGGDAPQHDENGPAPSDDP